MGPWRPVVLALVLLAGGPARAAAPSGDPPAGTRAEETRADQGWDDDQWGEGWGTPGPSLVLTGFVEAGLGGRLRQDEAVEDSLTLAETRWRLEVEHVRPRLRLGFKGDAWYDEVDTGLHGQRRELLIAFTRGPADVKLGTQVLTWGTGDLVFLNDLFPKDFVSFFAGRDDEYLKAPSDAARLSVYGDTLAMDLVVTPRFAPDDYLRGERFSLFWPPAGGIAAPGYSAHRPDDWPGDSEFALRLFATRGGTEYALYGYRGFFKQPSRRLADGRLGFAPLDAWGASLRRPLGPGLFNTEFAWYRSRDDAGGDDPAIANSQLRYLAGYEWEAAARFTLGLQYYLEWTLDHDALVEASPDPDREPEEYRQVLTTRLTWRSAQARLTASLFAFVSPSDEDYYLRPGLVWRHSDRWSWTAGANLFGGERIHTYFGQLEDNSNVYARVRFSY